MQRPVDRILPSAISLTWQVASRLRHASQSLILSPGVGRALICDNADIGHPKLFMVGEASAALFVAAADCE
jgi:hypothetical protein